MRLCYDRKPCFGKHGELCTVLERGTRDYVISGCPFRKPERDVTKGKRYPYNPEYGVAYDC